MKRALLFLAMFFGAVAASAIPVTIKLISFDGPFVNGIPTYPYTLQFPVANSFTAFTGMCDDYYHAGAPGDVWKAELTNLGTGNLTDLRFASAGLDAYQEAAWIFIQTYGTPSSQWPDMNFAVWHIFNPTVQITPQAQHWIDLAILFHSRLDYRGVFIATPVDINAPPTGDQEFFLALSGATTFSSPVPEPGSLGFLGTGALAVISTLRRSWKN